jgi:hypothetical protein
LLFQEGVHGLHPFKPTTTSLLVPPNLKDLLAVDYLKHLRPSVVLGYFISNGPNIFPLPCDLAGSDLLAYIYQVLLNIYQNTPAVATVATTAKDCTRQSEADGLLAELFDLMHNAAVNFNSGSHDGKSHVRTISSAASSATFTMLATSEKERDEQLWKTHYKLYRNHIFHSHYLYLHHQQQIVGSIDSSSSGGGPIGAAYSWKGNVNETYNWDLMLKCLDLFFQRLNTIVTEGSNVNSQLDHSQMKAYYRLWYETIMDIGSHAFK